MPLLKLAVLNELPAGEAEAPKLDAGIDAGYEPAHMPRKVAVCAAVSMLVNCTLVLAVR